MNAGLQILRSVPEFKDLIIKGNYTNVINDRKIGKSIPTANKSFVDCLEGALSKRFNSKNVCGLILEC